MLETENVDVDKEACYLKFLPLQKTHLTSHLEAHPKVDDIRTVHRLE
jgi:hypothetical protein